MAGFSARKATFQIVLNILILNCSAQHILYLRTSPYMYDKLKCYVLC